MQKTAIIIFANSAKAECLHKKLLTDADDNFRLFDQLNGRISAVVKKTGVPYFLFDENVQEGAIYGERIAHAMTFVYGKGFDNVVIVWNDCPKLEQRYIEIAIEELTKFPLVIGPDHWGGVYLLGVSKSVFNSIKFAALYWQSNVLAANLGYWQVPKYILPKLRVLNEWLPISISIKIMRNRLRSVFIKLHLLRAAT